MPNYNYTLNGGRWFWVPACIVERGFDWFECHLNPITYIATFDIIDFLGLVSHKVAHQGERTPSLYCLEGIHNSIFPFESLQDRMSLHRAVGEGQAQLFGGICGGLPGEERVWPFWCNTGVLHTRLEVFLRICVDILYVQSNFMRGHWRQ